LRKKAAQPPRYSMFPFFLGYTAAVLERDGFDVQAIDGVPLNLSYKDFLRHAVAAKPDVVLFEPSTPSINYVSRLSRELALATGARIIFAGPHVTSLPREVLAEHPHVEAVTIGEYEMTFLELARRMQRGQDFAGLDGVAYRRSAGAPARGKLIQWTSSRRRRVIYSLLTSIRTSACTMTASASIGRRFSFIPAAGVPSVAAFVCGFRSCTTAANTVVFHRSVWWTK
jgi:radical SAM superfamily enzyme YgiQ (UPF0313 family)